MVLPKAIITSSQHIFSISAFDNYRNKRKEAFLLMLEHKLREKLNVFIAHVAMSSEPSEIEMQ